MSQERILVVNHDREARVALCNILAEEGYEIREAVSGEDALSQLAAFAPDLILCDIPKPATDGLTMLSTARQRGSDAAFLVITGSAAVESAVGPMSAGADNCPMKPFDANAALLLIGKTLETRRLVREARQLRELARERYRLDGMVGGSPEMQAIYEVIRQVSGTTATVLVSGESGTGKEHLVQALHEQSLRKDRPFIRVACTALSETMLESELFGHEKGSFSGASERREGRFELADGGTLFLDEVGDLPPSMQVKVLRALLQHQFERAGGTQTIKVDVRVVAATNRDLAAEVKEGRFREDLYYRLNVVSVTLPPLRRRKGDIPALVGLFLEKYGQTYGKKLKGLAPDAMHALLAHDWPGNIRELENVIERAVVLARDRELTNDDLPPSLSRGRPTTRGASNPIPGATMEQIEREAILRTFEFVNRSPAKAAEMLGISVRKMQYRLKEFAVEAA